MRHLLLYLLLIAPLAYGAIWLADHPGDVTIDAFGYRLQSSLAVLASALLIGLFLFSTLILVLRALLALPRRFSARSRLNKQDQGISALSSAMASLAMADYAAARKHIARAEAILGKHAPAPLLLSAQLARASGDDIAAQNFQAMLAHDSTRRVGLRGLIEHKLQHQDLTEALKLAREAWSLKTSDRFMTLRLFDILMRLAQWNEAAELLKQGRRKHALSRSECRRYDAIIHYERALAAMGRGETERALGLAQLAEKEDNSFIPAHSLTLRLLAQGQAGWQALYKAIEKNWKDYPDSAMIAPLLAAAADQPPEKMLARVQKLAKRNPEHLESQLAIAEAAIAARDWALARQQLKLALAYAESPRIYGLLAEVEKAELGDEGLAADWLRRAVNAPKDPGWQCSQCGRLHETWQLHCPECEAFDASVLERGTRPIIAPVLSPEGTR